MSPNPVEQMVAFWRTLPDPVPSDRLEEVRGRLEEFEPFCRQVPEFWAIRCIVLSAVVADLYARAGGPTSGLAPAIARFRRARSRCQGLEERQPDLLPALGRADERAQGVVRALAERIRPTSPEGDEATGSEALSQIATHWTVLRQAHQGQEDDAARARQELMQRYCGAVYRYLLRAVRDPHLAEDLMQEFALRFIRGRFQHADPQRGRFRDYVRTALSHLVHDHYRRQGKEPSRVSLGETDPAAPGEGPGDHDQAFEDSWRQELLSRAWTALAQEQAASGRPSYDVLRFRVDHPDLPSPQMAEQLSVLLGRPLTAAGVRQMLHRARERFAELLLEETRLSLGAHARDRLEEELADLNLLKYCQDALDRQRE